MHLRLAIAVTSTPRARLWLVRAWVRIPFAAYFVDIYRSEKSLCRSVFSFQVIILVYTEALIAR